MKNYVISPEFHRHLWRQFGPSRLFAAPALMAVAAFLVWHFSGGAWLDKLHGYALFAYSVTTVLCGNYAAATALREDVKSRTWDFQRLSTVSPASLALGKLFGATSYVWYIALPLLAAILLTTPFAGVLETLETVFYFVMAGVFGHALAFLLSMESMQSLGGPDARRSQPAVFLPLVIGVLASYVVYAGFALATLNGKDGGLPVSWYGLSLPSRVFVPMAVVFLTGLCMMGASRLTASMMMYRQAPVCFAGGVLALALFFGGWISGAGFFREGSPFDTFRFHIFFLYILAMLLTASYYAMLVESKTPARFLWWAQGLRAARGWREKLVGMPRWVAAGALALAVYVLFCLWLASGFAPQGVVFTPRMIFGFVTAVFLFVLRDGLVMYLLSYGRASRHVVFERLVYYMAAYFFVPILHMMVFTAGASAGGAVLIGIGQQASVFHPIMYTAWYYPMPFANLAATLLPVTGEIAAVLFLWRRRLRVLRAAVENGE
jgi:hypothetical protein